MDTVTLQVFHIHVCTPLYPRVIFFFVTSYIVIDFNVSPKILLEPFLISTQINN